jgi:hypothetical protein
MRYAMEIFQMKRFIIKWDRLKEDELKLAIMVIFLMYSLLHDASNNLFYSINDGDVIWARCESSVSAVNWNWNDQHLYRCSL